MRNIFTLFKKSFLIASSILMIGTVNAQLGQYPFTGVGICPVVANAVTTQPANAVFSVFSTTGTTCAATANFFNNSAWTTAAAIDLAEYNEFTITPNACTVLGLTGLTFDTKLSGTVSTATLTVRSSLDGYVGNIGTFALTTTLSPQTLALPAATFTGVTSVVTFRFYINSITTPTTTFRMDNVTLTGTATTSILTNYYIDADGDGFGNLATVVNTCTPPVGYVANSTDCNDANAAIGAGILYYQDSDSDTYGNPLMSQTACTPPIGYVTNMNDCNDANPLITIATQTFYADADGDTYGNPSVTIGGCAPPVGYVYNNQDCDDTNPIITSATTTFYQDLDNDTYGNSSVTIVACTAPLGYVSINGDCNDNNNTIRPGAIEACDGLDNDCNGFIDDNVVVITWYQDADADTYGNPLMTQSSCSQPLGYVSNNTDCNDANATITIATTTYYQDLDNDTYGNPSVSIVACTNPVGYVTNNTDCNDASASITVATTFYMDMDADGFGNLAMPQTACTMPVGFVTNSSDCNDNAASTYPGAIEIPDNGIDEDCNGSDLSLIAPTLGLYEFTGVAICPVTATGVTTQPTGAVFGTYANIGGTCSVTANVFNNTGWSTANTIDSTKYNEFTITPDACKSLDLRNLIFTHKNSTAGGTATIVVRSSINNFSTNLGSYILAVPNVIQTDNLVLTAAFSNLTTPVTFRFYVQNILTTTATYRQDNVTLKGFINTLTPSTFYSDIDGDGYGNLNAPILACSATAGVVSNSTDCNDTDSLINPTTVWHQDSDGDGFGSTTVSLTQCTQPVGYVLTSNDCNDNVATITIPTIFYIDNDGDGFGGQNDTLACSIAVGLSATNNDCNDNNPAVTTQLNTYYLDTDNDGYGTTVTTQSCTQPAGYATNPLDCNDNNAQITLGTRFYIDTDGDGFGGSGASIISCTLPVGYASDSTDCNNANAAINPGATEILNNGIDDNCDGNSATSGLDNATIFNLKVFPNPGNNELTISFLNSVHTNLEVKISAADGKIVYANKIIDVTTINTSSLQNGMYFIQIQDENAKSIVRWIKM
jgi:hypothetical protein